MFPTVPRHNLPKTSEMVKALCIKYNVPYHTTGMLDGMKEIVDRLSNVSKLVKPKSP
jgi:fatty acid desaturase